MSYDKQLCNQARDIVKLEYFYQEAERVAQEIERLASIARQKADKALHELNQASQDIQAAPSPAPAPNMPVLEAILVEQKQEEQVEKKEKKRKRTWTKKSGCPADVPQEVYDQWLKMKLGSQSKFKRDYLQSVECGFAVGMYKVFLEKNGSNRRQPTKIDRRPPVICNHCDEESDDEEH